MAVRSSVDQLVININIRTLSVPFKNIIGIIARLHIEWVLTKQNLPLLS